MLIQTALFLIGIGVLYMGAESLVKGAASLALRFGIRPLVVGLTVVALGTSMPEFVINFFAALSGEPDIALGNIIGSNIANIALILGISALILPLRVSRAMLRKEYPMMMLAMGLFWLLASDGTISQLDGLILVIVLIVFLVYIVIDARRYSRDAALEGVSEVDKEDLKAPLWKKVLYLVMGIVLVSIGARLMVLSAINIAEFLGVPQVVIGLTIVAIGTSLPELAASVVSAMKDETELSVGNALGSNILNVLFVVGLVALIHPLEVSSASLNIHFPVMMGFCILFFPLAWTQRRITRVEGGILLLGFLGYMTYLILPYI